MPVLHSNNATIDRPPGHIKEPFRFFLDYIDNAYAPTVTMDLYIRDRVFSISFVAVGDPFVNREYERAWSDLYTLARKEGYLP